MEGPADGVVVCVCVGHRVTLRSVEDKRLLCCNEDAGVVLLPEEEVRQSGEGGGREGQCVCSVDSFVSPVVGGAY